MKRFTVEFKLLGITTTHKVVAIAEQQEDVVNFLVQEFNMEQDEVNTIRFIKTDECRVVLVSESTPLH